MIGTIHYQGWSIFALYNPGNLFINAYVVHHIMLCRMRLESCKSNYTSAKRASNTSQPHVTYMMTPCGSYNRFFQIMISTKIIKPTRYPQNLVYLLSVKYYSIYLDWCTKECHTAKEISFVMHLFRTLLNLDSFTDPIWFAIETDP